MVLCSFGIAACGKSEGNTKSAGQQKRKPRVTVEVLQERDVEYVIDAVGSVEAREIVAVPARVSGVVDRTSFQEGDEVTPETVIVEIDLERHRLAERRSQAEHDRALAQERLAATLYANRVKLRLQGRLQVPPREWVTEEQMAGWLADLEKARAEAARTGADLKLAERNLKDASVRPPVSGVIQKKNVSRGEYVKPETVVATILDVSALYVRFTVTELESARLKVPQEIRFRLRGVADREFRARLFFVGQSIDEATRSVECKAEVLEGKESLRAGMFAAVRVVTERRKGLILPERAVIPTETGFVVYVVEGGKASLRKVEIGLRTSDGVEVAGKLKAGDTLVVDGGSSLRPGAEVEVVEEPK